MLKRFSIIAFAFCLTLLLAASSALAADFKVAIMQDSAGAARKYKGLMDYLETKGLKMNFVATKNYDDAAEMFAKGEVDAMFSGSGTAGVFILKGLAYPTVRPVGTDGHSTYWAVVLAPKGAKKFDGSGSYFKGKKVIFSSLASSGEFFFLSVPGAAQSGASQLKAASHGAAIDALSRGQADVAIVKNRVWDKEKDKYAGLEVVGEDKGENPDNTLIVSNKTDKAAAAKMSEALLALESDSSAAASEARRSLGIKGYIKTTEADFSHTLGLLKSAGITKDFKF